MRLHVNRLEKCPLNRPTTPQSCSDTMGAYPKVGAHIHKASRDSIDRKDSIAALVATRRFPRGPSAIARFVIAVVVDAVNLHPFGAFSKIAQERRKFLPCPVISDAPTTVVLKLRGVWIGAALLHRIPRSISSGLIPPAIVTMLDGHNSGPFVVVLVAGRQRQLTACCDSIQLAA